MIYAVLAWVFILTLLGLKLYRTQVLRSLPLLIAKGRPGIANGAGIILWDISLLFSLFLAWYENISWQFLGLALFSSFLFGVFGLIDDLFDLNPGKKFMGESTLSAFIVFLFSFYYFPGFHPIISGGIFLLLLFLINAVNFTDILDGLAASLCWILFLSFSILFFKVGYGLSMYSLFWLICLSVFLTQNVYRPLIYLGDSGTHILGTILTLLCLEFLNKTSFQVQSYKTMLILFAPFLLDVSYVIIIRIFHKESIFAKQKDHLPFWLIQRTNSTIKPLFIYIFLQAICSIAAISVLSGKW